MHLIAEKYYKLNPYAYCGDNPVSAVDPDGRQVRIHYVDKNGSNHIYILWISWEGKNYIPQKPIHYGPHTGISL